MWTNRLCLKLSIGNIENLCIREVCFMLISILASLKSYQKRSADKQTNFISFCINGQRRMAEKSCKVSNGDAAEINKIFPLICFYESFKYFQAWLLLTCNDRKLNPSSRWMMLLTGSLRPTICIIQNIIDKQKFMKLSSNRSLKSSVCAACRESNNLRSDWEQGLDSPKMLANRFWASPNIYWFFFEYLNLDVFTIFKQKSTRIRLNYSFGKKYY